MMILFRFSTLALTAVALAGSAAAVHAQTFMGERAALDLNVSKSYVKTIPYALAVPVAGTPIFSPTTITCSKKANCLVQVLVHTYVSDLVPGDMLQVSVHVGNQAGSPGDLTAGLLTFRARPVSADELTAHGQMWVAEVPPGSHTVTVRANTWSNVAAIGGRTLAITVLQK